MIQVYFYWEEHTEKGQRVKRGNGSDGNIRKHRESKRLQGYRRPVIEKSRETPTVGRFTYSTD